MSDWQYPDGKFAKVAVDPAHYIQITTKIRGAPTTPSFSILSRLAFELCKGQANNS
jgi:hypothetical protein